MAKKTFFYISMNVTITQINTLDRKGIQNKFEQYSPSIVKVRSLISVSPAMHLPS